MQRLNKLTVVVCAGLSVAMLVLTGCVSENTAKARERAAFTAGEKRGAAMQSDMHVIWVVGNVQQPLVTWTADLTLAKAIVAANYQGAGDPGMITVFRNGQPPVQVFPKRILKGFDMPLLAGDRIEIHP